MGECFFWYRPTRVVPEERPLNSCVCVASVPCIHIRIEWVLINFIVPSCQLLPPSKVNISVSNSHHTDVAIYKLYVLWSIYQAYSDHLFTMRITLTAHILKCLNQPAKSLANFNMFLQRGNQLYLLSNVYKVAQSVEKKTSHQFL